MDVWQIGVKISLANAMSPVLAVIAADLLGIKGKVGEVEKAFTGWKLAIAGAGAALAGSAIVAGVFKLADGGKALLDQQDKLQRTGMSYNRVLEIQAKYFSEINKAIPTSTASEYLKAINENQSVVGVNVAEKFTPTGLMVDEIIGNATGKKASGSGFNLLRALEMRGTTMTDFEGTSKLMNAMAQNIVGSGGKLDATTYQTMAKRGGVAWINASPEFITGGASVLASDLGGDTAGTAIMTLYQMLSGATTLSKQQYEALERAKMIDSSKVSVDKGGRINVGPGGIVGSKMGMENQHAWVRDVLAPHVMEAAGGDKVMYDSLLAKIGRNRNTTRALTMFGDPGFNEQIEKDTQLWRGSSTVEKAYGDSMQRNPLFVDKAFHEQFKSMMEAIGGPLAQAAIPVMKDLTAVFQNIGRFANNNPGTIKLVGEALIGLGVGLAAIGTIAVVGAAILLAPGGLITVAIGGISAAIVAIVGMNWRAVVDVFDGIYNAIVQFIEKMKALVASIAGAILGAASGIGNFQPFKPRINRDPNHPSLFPADPASYVPPSPPAANQNSVIHTSIQLDGRTLAKAVSQHMANNGAWSNSSSSFDGRAMPAPTDVSYI